MLGLLIRLEYKRQALRRRVLGSSSEQGHTYFAIAGALFLLMIVPPITGIELLGIIPLLIASVLILPLAPIFL